MQFADEPRETSDYLICHEPVGSSWRFKSLRKWLPTYNARQRFCQLK